MSLQGRHAEAVVILQASLALFTQHVGQFDRQEANTALKLAELYARQRHYQAALQLLNRADDLARPYGHYYDLLWRIELARALIFFWQGRFDLSFLKIRSAFRYRRRLQLSFALVVRQVLMRWWSRLAFFFRNQALGII